MPLGLPAAGIVRTPDNFEAPIKAFVDNLETVTNAAVSTAAAAVTTANQKYTKPSGGIPATDLVATEIVKGDGTVLRIVKLTQAQYDALTPKVATTLYLIA